MFSSIVCYIKYSSDVRDVYKTEKRELWDEKRRQRTDVVMLSSDADEAQDLYYRIDTNTIYTELV